MSIIQINTVFVLLLTNENIVTTENMKNKQSENAEDKISADFWKFSPYLIIEILSMRKIFHNKLSFTGAGFLN